ncbi:hypothetical protein QAD02_010557 [Eretmocerus hayati]|uniref:Uncharacterized protein n=1 Tax=Eretmocerus hayati TaxID=131215 RepID=A0ACC2NVZ4_9HYME|nr:hypothetical protein QAD02_010557 [Eretmocerus hayati]
MHEIFLAIFVVVVVVGVASTPQQVQSATTPSWVLKPPGGGSSDIFGPAGDDRPRQVRQNLHASSLGGGFFNGNSAGDQQDSAGIQQQQQQSLSNGSSAPDTPRSNKPGNDSYKRLFGPPDARKPSTPNSKNHMRSNISLSSSESGSEPQSPRNGYIHANGNATHLNDITDGNPVTGAGYDGSQHNGGGSAGSSSAGSEKSSTDSSPSVGSVPRLKNRVPPGGFSSGLW